jgi:hypothetical protein
MRAVVLAVACFFFVAWDIGRNGGQTMREIDVALRHTVDHLRLWR